MEIHDGVMYVHLSEVEIAQVKREWEAMTGTPAPFPLLSFSEHTLRSVRYRPTEVLDG